MRSSHTFTISLPPDLAAEVDRLAAQEHRSQSELFREAFRRYVNSQQRWERILDFGSRAAEAAGLDTEGSIDAAVDEAVRDVHRLRQHSRQRQQ
jgi:predicted transcriptional regulator